MGLFGGFKAKLTGKSKSKEKVLTGVVPLKFSIHSEFCSYNSKQISNEDTLKEVTPRPATRSSTFENNRKALQEKLKNSVKTNPSNEPSSVSDSPPIQKENEPITKTIERSNDFEESNVTLAFEKDHAISSTLSGTSSKSNSINNGASVVVTKNQVAIPRAKDNDDYVDDTPSTLIMMTQHSPEVTKPNIFPKTSDTGQNFSETPNSFEQDEEQYKINTEQHLKNYESEDEEYQVKIVEYDRSYVSEDELSYQEDEEPVSDFMGVSSQAASIFFGNSSGSHPTRPRKINITKDENKDDEDDEIDC